MIKAFKTKHDTYLLKVGDTYYDTEGIKYNKYEDITEIKLTEDILVFFIVGLLEDNQRLYEMLSNKV